MSNPSIPGTPPAVPSWLRQYPIGDGVLDAGDRFRLRGELDRVVQFVNSPIPWRNGDYRSNSEWCAENHIPEGDGASMGPHWAEEISRLAVMIHTRLGGGWPAYRCCPDDESVLVWELLVRLVDRDLKQETIRRAALRSEEPPSWTQTVGRDQERVCRIMIDVLRNTQSQFDRFKAALRSVVESMLTDPLPHTPPPAVVAECAPVPLSFSSSSIDPVPLAVREPGQPVGLLLPITRSANDGCETDYRLTVKTPAASRSTEDAPVVALGCRGLDWWRVQQ